MICFVTVLSVFQFFEFNTKAAFAKATFDILRFTKQCLTPPRPTHFEPGCDQCPHYKGQTLSNPETNPSQPCIEFYANRKSLITQCLVSHAQHKRVIFLRLFPPLCSFAYPFHSPSYTGPEPSKEHRLACHQPKRARQQINDAQSSITPSIPSTLTTLTARCPSSMVSGSHDELDEQFD